MNWFLKSFALLHDPPHKALWFEDADYRVYDKNSHEEEAAKLFDEIFKGMGFGGVPGSEESAAVAEADRLAASFDRWALPPSPGNYWVKAKYMINPFGRERREIKKPTPQEFRERLGKFVGEVRRVLEAAKGDERWLYFAFYAAYELAWIKAGLPTLPADTRVPTHSIFDHLYATASMLNWTRGGGCLMVVDLPGIQSILKSARKAGDYRAGSLLVSLVAWRVAWRFMERHGPDILLSPTPRFNPLFYAQLDRRVKGVWGLYAGAMSYYVGKKFGVSQQLPVDEWLHGLIRRSSLFPGTLYLALPECKGEDEAYSYFDEVLKEVLEAARGGEAPNLPFDLGGLDDGVKRVVEAGLKGLESVRYLPIRVAVAYVEEGLRNLEKWTTERFGIDDEVKKLLGGDLRRFLFARLLEMVNERKRRALPKYPSWFDKEGRPRFSQTYKGTWMHSSLDPSQPAVVKFGGVFKDGNLTYDDETHSWLKSLGIEEKKDANLTKVFKPKEALGPVDLIKRALYLRSAKRAGIDSVEVVALNYYYLKHYFDSERCREIKGLVERVLDGEDVEDVFGSSEAADRRLAECKGAGEEPWTPGLEYVVIRADGDNVGKLLRGCLPKEPQMPQDVEVVRDREQFEKDMKHALRVLGAMRETAKHICGGGYLVVPSPAYYAAVSAALMVTAIGDAAIVEKSQGELVFAGGDDLLAFSAKPPSFDIVKETRENYWGEGGFHSLSESYFLPALTAYGRSYSLRVAHAVTDMMSVEVDKAAELLDEAKDRVPGKDALAISTSTGHVGFTKVSAVGSVKAIAEAYARRTLGRNLPYDVEAWGEAAEVEYVLRYLVGRNTDKKELADKVVEAACYVDGRGEKWKNAVELLKALRAWI
ncbi:type III-B CRISPR-associated protein Cas10/Cmr2 [Pyrobaculum calidifontis]|uniref:CRISPR-associated protein, Cmr2 family n=1 Tax=Pyrobaculum calidifontis (strain DSM 21063 / JCM 11548 / VA1) TaxID=410359 RepID=A3MVP1_PYRCJ|nr:type III-B CRISPR-associated protein Cas10/Cmr2 [Pyrobaculum calidifontis]ABO08708.1 CRISPR-associated protein, Cmr2 family [Pyrobaculum calidifontis JCM 11548]